MQGEIQTVGKLALIIGAGFLGSQIGAAFEALGWQVVTCSFSGAEADYSCDVGDLRSVEKLAAQLGICPAVLVHCASSGRGGGVEGYQRVYRDGAKHLTSAFPDSHLIYTGSTSVYGQTHGEVVTESAPTHPPAATGKVLLEAEAAVLANQGTVMRLAGIYGPDRSVILRKFLAGESVIEVSDRSPDGRILNQIHRDDAAAAVCHVALNCNVTRGEIYNLADQSPLTQRACFTELARVLNRPIPPDGPPALGKKRGWTHKRVSSEKLRNTGWQPKYPSFIHAVPKLIETIVP